ncbi:MAG: benzoylsuccinyl-CoA thiolase [Desulfobacteraceae bacterium]|jgi:benzoylsuccinyl-CoA thiolase BbsA subunit|nr:MAG: benzoylsuccinyl-CoA thiolase [Desulfobacteraceae bacterium]
MGNEKAGKKMGQKEKEGEADITFYHSDLVEVPTDGSPPFLKGYRCKSCGQLDFPKLSICPGCWGAEFEMVPLSRKGTLYAFAEVFLGQPGMTYPMTIGYVDLPENIRIFAQIEGKAEQFNCNDAVELTIGTIRTNRDGLPITSYKFKKAES